MKFSFLAAVGVAGLLLASCSEDKNTESMSAAATAADSDTTAVGLITTSASPIPTVYPTADDTIAFRDDARHLAGRVAGDLKLTDKATERRLENAYLTRRQRLFKLDARYAADTAGRHAAVRRLNDDTDREVRQVLPSPALVRTYERSRAAYYDGPATVESAAEAVEAEAVEATTGTAPPAAPTARAVKARAARRGPHIVKYKKVGREVKIKYSNGMTLKIDEKGNRTVRYGLGAKAKAAADNIRRRVK